MPKVKPKPRVQPQESGQGIRVTPKSLGIAAAGAMAILTLLTFSYNAIRNIATKGDIESLKISMVPTFTQQEQRIASAEERIRNLELQAAAHFGASPTAATVRPSSSDENPRFLLTDFVLPDTEEQSCGGSPCTNTQPTTQQQPTTAPTAQTSAQAAVIPKAPIPLPPLPQRIVVVPTAMIVQYRLTPTRGGTLAMLGEDGHFYSLDDILAAHLFGTYKTTKQ